MNIYLYYTDLCSPVKGVEGRVCLEVEFLRLEYARVRGWAFGESRLAPIRPGPRRHVADQHRFGPACTV